MDRDRVGMVRSYLPQSTADYFDKFVDPKYGEVWTALNPDGTPKTDMPKAWHWKAAYHTFEHTLVGYITAQGMRRLPATRPFSDWAIDALEKVSDQDGFSVQKAAFSSIR